MPLPENPLNLVFPLIIGSKTTPVMGRQFLGTAFLIDGRGGFLTAAHVVRRVDPDVGDEGLFAVIIEDSLRTIPLGNLIINEDHDLAFGRLEDYESKQFFEIAASQPAINLDVMCIEYSRTSSRSLSTSLQAMEFSPVFRKGHVLRYVTSTLIGRRPTMAIEISFPALRGASGAPVVVERTGQVVGLVVGNIEHELLPAQIERVDTATGRSEERKYFLPEGQAVAWSHLRDFVDRTNDS